ncbi:MAG TPA: MoxR family ATPase [Deltaproteobacteria bacterium]|nr:MoxR family ATPase [Deltaproteobacteria bacterium]HOM30072.1 MoxR family ATPase [Deltaproteobacteria bacterium]HPP79711.1 MoxR family ATPase [Deltaproteobacteria bacterium]
MDTGPDTRIRCVMERMHEVYLGRDEVISCILAALLAGGHVLLEGVPGVGKTLIAITLSRLFDLSFKRIQFTNDMLPSDVTGFHTLRGETGAWEMVKGPIFASIVLADEINRTSPKTQSALLEAMEEAQVTIDGVTYELPRPFMVIATQNPVEIAGTFPLPESQLDRFLMKLSVEYPPLKEEREILMKDIDHADALKLRPVMTKDELVDLADEASTVSVHPDVISYIVNIVRATRVHPRVELGVSPRGGLALKRAAQAWAYISGRNFVTPGDVATLAPFVLSHRIISKDGDPGGLVEEVLREVEVPL